MQLNSVPFLRLIGDITADRGSSDFLVLKIIKRLRLGKTRVEILLSNHDFEFINNYETQVDLRDHVFGNIGYEQSGSANNCRLFLRGYPHYQKEMRAMIDEDYKPCLKLVSYTLSEDKKEIAIFSHAAIDLDVIKGMATKLKVPYQDKTPEELANTIDEVNRVFQQKKPQS